MGYFEYTDEMYKKSKYDDDTSLIKTINNIVAISKRAREDGVLSLEESIDNIQDEFKKTLMLMFVDGVPPNLIFEYGYNIIQTSEIEGTELRNMMIYNRGIVMICEGHNPKLVKQVLNSMIGLMEDWYEENSFCKDDWRY